MVPERCNLTGTNVMSYIKVPKEINCAIWRWGRQWLCQWCEKISRVLAEHRKRFSGKRESLMRQLGREHTHQMMYKMNRLVYLTISTLQG